MPDDKPLILGPGFQTDPGKMAPCVSKRWGKS